MDFANDRSGTMLFTLLIMQLRQFPWHNYGDLQYWMQPLLSYSLASHLRLTCGCRLASMKYSISPKRFRPDASAGLCLCRRLAGAVQGPGSVCLAACIRLCVWSLGSVCVFGRLDLSVCLAAWICLCVWWLGSVCVSGLFPPSPQSDLRPFAIICGPLEIIPEDELQGKNFSRENRRRWNASSGVHPMWPHLSASIVQLRCRQTEVNCHEDSNRPDAETEAVIWTAADTSAEKETEHDNDRGRQRQGGIETEMHVCVVLCVYVVLYVWFCVSLSVSVVLCTCVSLRLILSATMDISLPEDYCLSYDIIEEQF